MSILFVNTNRVSHAKGDLFLKALWGLGGVEVKHKGERWTRLSDLTTEQAKGWRDLMIAHGVAAKAIEIKTPRDRTDKTQLRDFSPEERQVHS